MGQSQIISAEVPVKSPPNFDTIPEDVALSVVKFIQSWAKEEGNQEERERGRKARDSTLRAAALTSSKSFEAYFTSLLQHVTLDVRHVFSFCQVLERGEPHYGPLVRSIRFEQWTDYSSSSEGQKNHKLVGALSGSFSTLPTTAASSDRFWQGIRIAIGRCYRQVVNLESLVILNYSLSFFHHFFHHKIGEQVKPQYFLSSSLKRLFMPLWSGGYSHVNSNINARNATWLLLFCRQIEEACLGFQMSVEDSEYLSEFVETFVGLSSVKKLAIKVKFVYKEEEKKTWWGGPEEQNGTYKGGNRKTESTINFLQSTNQLDALEIHYAFSNRREGDHSDVSLDCLSTLSRSFTSLKHLRLIGSRLRLETGPLCLSFFFEALKILTLNSTVLSKSSRIGLPESLEILCFPFYSRYPTLEGAECDYREDNLLSDMIEGRCHNLKEVVVPSRPIGADGEETLSPREIQLWAERRRELERSSSIRAGKVKLRTVQVGEVVGDVLKGEVFMSTVRWISPP